MTARATPQVHEIDVRDSENRTVSFRVQVGPGAKVSCWTTDAPGGSITVTQLFALCAQQSAKETGTR